MRGPIRRLTIERTSFGFEQVAATDKPKLVYNVFAKVAEKYDLMNDVMSGGLHRLWKDHFVSYLHPLMRDGMRVLDVAGGTGDIAFRICDGTARRINNGNFSVTVVDINRQMLEVGQARAAALRHKVGQLQWVEKDAEQLVGLESNFFDAYTIAFGIRNCTYPDRVLLEAHRVLRPGGRFLCLELSSGAFSRSPFLRRLYDQYSFQLIPILGQLIAADYSSYKYLVESIRRFPDQATFKGMIEKAGFERVAFENLFGGVATIHSAWKPQ